MGRVERLKVSRLNFGFMCFFVAIPASTAWGLQTTWLPRVFFKRPRAYLARGGHEDVSLPCILSSAHSFACVHGTGEHTRSSLDHPLGRGLAFCFSQRETQALLLLFSNGLGCCSTGTYRRGPKGGRFGPKASSSSCSVKVTAKDMNTHV